jgi:hypothetical protein
MSKCILTALALAPLTLASLSGTILPATTAFAATPTAQPTAIIQVQGTSVTSVRVAHHPGYDRVVFDFRGPVPSGRTATYVTKLIADASGKTIPIRGRYIIRIVFHTATAATAAERTLTPGLPGIQQVKPAGNFEGYVSYGIGVQHKGPLTLHVLHGPNRVYLDVPTR